MPRKKYQSLFGAAPLVWIKDKSPIIVFLTPLFTRGVFLRLLPRSRSVLFQLMLHAYETQNLYIKNETELLCKKLGLSLAELKNGINELSRTPDHVLGRKLIEFIGKNKEFITIPWLNVFVIPIINHARDFYKNTGKFSRLTQEQKEKKLKKGSPLRFDRRKKRFKKSA